VSGADVLEPLMAHGTWATNAELIADLGRMGRYLHDDYRTLDPTWGKGRFWTLWQPADLTGCDLNPAKSPIGYPVDFTALPFDPASFDAVVFDPPYKLNGTPSAADEPYGVDLVASREERHRLIRLGITECVRVVRPDGWVLVKCQDQVNGGKVRWQTRMFADHAEALGCRLVDAAQIESYRPQPPGTAQKHLRRNYSTLLIFQATDRSVPSLFSDLSEVS
jgi:hypothetical protein